MSKIGSDIKFLLPAELYSTLDKYSQISRQSKEEILKNALIEFFKDHPIEHFQSNPFSEVAPIVKKTIIKNLKEE